MERRPIHLVEEPSMLTRIRNLVVALGLVASLAGGAEAIPLNCIPSLSTEHLGACTGSATYNAANATSATLTITLDNTSPAGNGGYITAFAFNNPGNLI